MAVHLWTHFASAAWRCQTPWLRRCGVARGRLVLSPLCNRLRNSQDGGHSSGLLIEVCFRKQNQCPKNEGHQRHIVPLEKGAGDAVFDSREIHYLLCCALPKTWLWKPNREGYGRVCNYQGLGDLKTPMSNS